MPTNESDPHKLVGTMLDRYRIQELVRVSASGAIYRATHQWTANTVALEIVRASDLSKLPAASAKVFDAGVTADSTAFRVMEWPEAQAAGAAPLPETEQEPAVMPFIGSVQRFLPEKSAIVPAALEAAPRDLSAGYALNPWSYAVLAGLIGLACTSEPGGLAGWQGYLLGFASVFLSFGLLELAARRYFQGASQ